ncbi:GNAT family N-acetyltransferase [Neobacillus vireti]|uniref:GCN5-like N-acetyltransferase n=1 Tax=Neobacillus vireti LMG 21834 TaxID=1131730 RepID=A0AB94IQY5_9BACI|nr:GNAT family N-acetyltransferase [Neobacillus vireti]ETI69469.1 GCN5-like N-acetyltransferase [Neobacillus vireti LMG 21834]KLT19287.1 GCN5 family acetyltransferase [Neobacillus vireti]
MQELSFVKNYKENFSLRTSFNRLAASTFGIQFETWYQHGFWTEKYQPYSYVDNGQVIANVSVNLLTLVINNEEKQAVQIGTVMTHPDYRNQGLARKLMDKVLADFSQVDFIYLFANQTVLDFYPKFGFAPVEEVQFSMDYCHIPAEQLGVRKLDGSKPDDLTFVHTLAAERISGSKHFGTKGSEELLMFYCLMVFNQDLYYLEEEKCLVICQRENTVLHLYDVISEEKVVLKDILRKIADNSITKIILHYHPDDNEVKLDKQPYQSKLFVKNMTGVKLPKEFKHPFTSQA